MTQNRKKIRDAFKKAKTEINDNLEKGLTDLLEAGVNFCLSAHDGGHQAHLQNVGDSYGWVLVHNGKEVNRKIFGNGPARGNADAQLSFIASKGTKNGWSGFVLAGLQPATYFLLRYEAFVMRRGIGDLTAVDFSKYFDTI